jgi:hypothetical protein
MGLGIREEDDETLGYPSSHFQVNNPFQTKTNVIKIHEDALTE